MTLQDDKQVIGTLKITDKKGNPAAVDGVPVWTSDGTLLTVTPTEDGLSATIVPIGALGHAQVTATADADLGEGVEPLIGILEVDIVGGKATVITIEAGAPTDQP